MRTAAAMVRRAMVVWVLLLGSLALGDSVITTEQLLAHLKLHTDPKELLALIEQRDIGLDVSEVDLPRLAKAGLPGELQEVIADKIARPSVYNVLRRKRAGKTDAEIIEWIFDTGRTLELSAEEKQRLLAAKVSLDVIRAIEGTYVYPGFKVYRHPLGAFSVQYPADWKVHRLVSETVNTGLVISPQEKVRDMRDVTTGFSLSMVVDSARIYRRRRYNDVIKEFDEEELPALLLAGRSTDLKPAEGWGAKTEQVLLSGQPGASRMFTARHGDEEVSIRHLMGYVGGVHFFPTFVAPSGSYSKLANTYEKMRRTIRFMPIFERRRRLPKPMAAGEAMRRYRQSVVQVRTPTGWGSGFFVRSDGYILTNWHVIFPVPASGTSARTLPKPPSPIYVTILGDEGKGVPARRLEARVVDGQYKTNPVVDLVLLKVPTSQGPFTPIPLSSVRSGEVRDGDAVVAIGFPKPGKFGDKRIFVTEGIVSNISYVRGEFGRSDRRTLESILTTAEINPGNSGGPCVDLHTGGVLGLNTQIPLDRGQRLGYDQTVAIDHALRAFPQIMWYRHDGEMQAYDHLILGEGLMVGQMYDIARKELLLAQEKIEQLPPILRARLYTVLYMCEIEMGAEAADAEKLLAQAMREDPKSFFAQKALALALSRRGKTDDAVERINEALQLRPHDAEALLLRAQFQLASRRYAAALNDIDTLLTRQKVLTPRVYAMKGRVLLAMNEPRQALDAFHEATKLNAYDVEAHLGIVDCYEKMNETETARELLEALLQGAPRTAAFRARLAELLAKAGNETGALAQLSEAVRVANESGQDVPIEWVDRLIALARRVNKPTEEVRGWLTLARLRPGRQGDVLANLAKLWARVRRPGLAWAHAMAIANVKERPQGLSPAPLALPADVNELIRNPYPLEMFQAVVSAGAIGAPISREDMQRLLVEKGWALGKVLALWQRRMRDVTEGDEALAGNVKLKMIKGLTRTDAGGYIVLEATNRGAVPLCGIELQCTYYGKDRKAIAQGRVPMVLDASLRPGASQTVRVDLIGAEALKAVGHDWKELITWHVVPVSARNAEALAGIQTRIAKRAAGGFSVRLVNTNGDIRLRRVTIVTFPRNRKDEPYKLADGRVVRDVRTVTLDVGPGESSEAFVFADHFKLAFWQERGLAKDVPGSEVGIGVRIVDAVGQYEPSAAASEDTSTENP